MPYIIRFVWRQLARTWVTISEPIRKLLVGVIAGNELLNSSKKIIIATICLMFGLTVSNEAIAVDSRLVEFQSKIEKMAESMNKFRLGTSSYYTINAVKEGVLANTKVWNTNSSGYGLSARCEITVNQNMMEGFNLSDDTIAWVIGHELGHCELGHNRFKQLFVNKVQQRFINGVT